jgi:hypothetical protein
MTAASQGLFAEREFSLGSFTAIAQTVRGYGL